MFPEDLGIDVATATRDWLAARTINDLVTASGGLYAPPAKFRAGGEAERNHGHPCIRRRR